MDRNYFDLKDNVAIVTGCSGGLGVQMAKALASQGASIVAVARRKERIEAVANQIAEEFGVPTFAVQCDIKSTDAVDAMVDAVIEKFGRIDILINNAGTGAIGNAEDITDEQFENEMQIDLFGSFRVARAVAKKAMIPAKYGRIINIASMYGLVGNMVAGSTPYHAAKGGVVNMTRALAAEWGKHGITVNAIGPGLFESEMTASTLFRSEEFLAAYNALNPAGRPGGRGELNGTVLYLSCDASSYVQGQLILVDGGATLV